MKVDCEVRNFDVITLTDAGYNTSNIIKLNESGVIIE